MYASSIPSGRFSPSFDEEREKIFSLKDFNAAVSEQDFLDLGQQLKLVEQALLLLKELYVHRPQKRALYAVNPIERLEVLRRRLHLDTRKFHEEMISIFLELRDRHTSYILSARFRSSVAFLPFLIEEFYVDNPDAEFLPEELRNNDNRYYLISKISTKETFLEKDLIDTLEEKKLLEKKEGRLVFKKSGLIITHWNGIPIDRAVELNADLFAGSNEEARHARGLQNMTIRPLFNALPPDEEEGVIIKYYDLETEKSGDLPFKWQVWESGPLAGDRGNEYLETALGIDSVSELVRRVKQALFQKENEIDYPKKSLLRKVFRFKTLETEYGKLGYIRIFTFDANYVAVLYEFIRIIKSFPKDIEGLIIDVRGNSGGLIPAAALLLQLLTPRLIEPQRFQFLSTPLTLQLCQVIKRNLLRNRNAVLGALEPWEKNIFHATDQMWGKWKNSIKSACETGALYSHSIPLTPIEALQYVQQIDPDLPRRFNNRVLLITDALSYSATDMFAAGFQDNNIGLILGTNGITGGGGGNVWFHNHLETKLAEDGEDGVDDIGRVTATRPVEEPKGPTFTVAVRRSIRVGVNEGNPLEDWGVVPEIIHRLTQADLLYNNKDLLTKMAPEILLNSVTNQEIISAFSEAAEELSGPNKDLIDKAGLELTPANAPYDGPEIDQLPNLSHEEKQTIKAELPFTNQDILNAFEWAAADLRISQQWIWMEAAGAGSVDELSKSKETRAASYTGLDIDDLDLDPNTKDKIKGKLLTAVENRTISPAYRNTDVEKAFKRATSKLFREELMFRAGLELSELTEALQAPYKGGEIDQLPHLSLDEKNKIKKKLPSGKKFLSRAITN